MRIFMFQFFCLPEGAWSTEYIPTGEPIYNFVFIALYTDKSEIDPSPIYLASEYVHDSQYFFYMNDDFENQEPLAYLKPLFFGCLHKVMKTYNLKCFVKRNSFVGDHIVRKTKNQGFDSDSLVELPSNIFVELLTQTYDSLYSGFAFLTENSNMNKLAPLVKNDWFYKIEDKSVLDYCFLYFNHNRDELAYEIESKRISMQEFIKVAELKRINDELMSLSLL